MNPVLEGTWRWLGVASYLRYTNGRLACHQEGWDGGRDQGGQLTSLVFCWISFTTFSAQQVFPLDSVIWFRGRANTSWTMHGCPWCQGMAGSSCPFTLAAIGKDFRFSKWTQTNVPLPSFLISWPQVEVTHRCAMTHRKEESGGRAGGKTKWKGSQWRENQNITCVIQMDYLVHKGSREASEWATQVRVSKTGM